MKKKTMACLFVCAIVCTLALCTSTPAQTVFASVTGRVLDPNAAVIVEATVAAKNVDTGIETTVHTNEDGIYHFADLGPGNYEFSVSKRGFKVIVKPGVTLHVADTVSMNFTMQVGDVRETVTVEAGAPLINTESAAVSTVVDRQFAENLPMNGRSFQTLIQLTPGVVITANNNLDSGQFSVNGQRATSNYWTVDGVGANVGISGSANGSGNGFAGSVGSVSVLGGTNSLVSVDAMQEFRIQTSTFAPEFGRTPGAQISILTRSGGNQFHGTAFDYLRNDIFDANNWFNTSVTPAIPKAEDRQNDFGGTFSGPITKGKSFYFFSYEGLRLRLPQTVLSSVPDLSARQNAQAVMKPFLNAFPMPNGSDNTTTEEAQFNASYSAASSLDAYSLRIDHRLKSKLYLFGRYNYSPSELVQRGLYALSVPERSRTTAQTTTIGATWFVSSELTSEARFNYSRTNASSSFSMDNFGGAVPLASLPFPSQYTNQNAFFSLNTFSALQPLAEGKGAHNVQRQINLVDTVSAQVGGHSIKFGIDYRRLSPIFDPTKYQQVAFFFDVPSIAAANLAFGNVFSSMGSTLLFQNLGLFAQDTWRFLPRLTLTYGVRWDVDFAPSSVDGPGLLAVTGFDLNDLSKLALAPTGRPPFKTTYTNFAPRIGLAYQISQSPKWQTVFRGGFGVFYDLATTESGTFLSSSYPFGAVKPLIGPGFGGPSTFPLDPNDAAPPPITTAGLAKSGGTGTVYAFDPNLKLPYTLQWNIAMEQAVGKQQTISASYVGAKGSRLLQSVFINNSPTLNFATADLVSNAATSDYDALQIQFRRALSHGLQALASYTWSHSIDDGSASSYGNRANAPVPSINANRGASDFDVRHGFSVALTYDLPTPKLNAFGNGIARGWSLENVVQAFSAPPVNAYYGQVNSLLSVFTFERPDVVPGVPFYLYGPQYPGGKAINNTIIAGACPGGLNQVGPFCPPPASNGVPLRQGDLPRNALRGFGAAQWDFAVHREFPIRESVRLQFRAEMFNVLNHPNFGPPDGNLGSPQSLAAKFGLSTQMLGQSLAGNNVGNGAFSPLYQIGAPRSIQFALKLMF